MNDKTAADMVRERLEISRKAQQSDFDRAVENEKFYHAVIDETSHPFLSNICLPWPYIIVESYLGKCIQVMAATLPYVRVVEEDDDSRQKAKVVERDVNMVFYRQKWPIFAYKVYKMAFKYGTAFVLEQPWGEIEGREMPVFHQLPYFGCFYNPRCTELYQDDAYFIIESFVPLKSYARFKGNPNYKNLNRIEAHEGDTKSPHEKEIMSFRDIPDSGNDSYSNWVKQWLYWDHDSMIVVTNERNVIRNSRNFLDGMIPVKAIRPIPLEDQFLGMSILEQGKGLFTEANENRNQYNDAVNLMLNPMYIVRSDAGLHRGNIVSRPGGIIYMDDITGIKPNVVDWNILSQSLARAAMIERDIQNYSNAFPQMRGQPISSRGTATSDIIMRQAGELRSDTYNLLLSMMSIEDMAKDVVMFKRMFMTSEEDFYYWPEQKTVTATPEDYAGNFTFKAIAGYKMAREIERKQLIEAMTLVFGNHAFLPWILPRANEWLERLIDYFDLRSPEQLFASDTGNGGVNEETLMQLLPQLIAGGTGGGMTVEGLPRTLRQPSLSEKPMRMGPELEPNPEMGNILSEIVPRS